MVSNIGGTENRENQESDNSGDPTVRVVHNHSFDHNLIRELLKSSLDPLIVDPVPSSIFIHNIEIKNINGELSITCDVAFESVHRD